MASVQVYVSRLRKLLPPETLVTRPPGYLLGAEPDEIDLFRFERLLAEGGKALAADNPESAAGLLREALQLWRGPALAEFAPEPFAKHRGRQARRPAHGGPRAADPRPTWLSAGTPM